MIAEPLIWKVDDIDLQNVIFTKLQKNKKGGYSLNLKHNNNGNLSNIYIQTPRMFCPFGAISFGKENKKYTINLSFENKNNNPLLEDLYNKFNELDDIVTNNFLSNPAWLKALDINKYNFDEIRSLQNCLIKYSKNKENNPPYLNIKLNSFNNDKFLTEIFDSKKNKINLTFDNIENTLVPSIYSKALIHIVGMWFLNGRFCITLRALQFVLYPNDKLRGYSFMDFSDEENISDDEDNDMDVIEL